MERVYDATLRNMLMLFPEELVRFLCLWLPLRPTNVRSLETDISTTMRADGLFDLLHEGNLITLHLEFQSTYDPDLPLRMRQYNNGIHYRRRVPGISVALLLRPEADGPEMTDISITEVPQLFRSNSFEYEVLRLWRLPFDGFLNSSPSLLSLSILTDEAAADLRSSFTRIKAKIDEQVPDPGAKKDILTRMVCLSGLR